jgi:riboflavin synthase
MFFELMKETISHTTLRKYRVGSLLNLERSLKWGDRIGGHFILGHVDCIGIIKRKIKEKNYAALEIAVPKKISKYIIPKGSIAVDGISLTVGTIKGNTFTAHLIPHTLKITALRHKDRLDSVNIETDFLAKYFLKNR